MKPDVTGVQVSVPTGKESRRYRILRGAAACEACEAAYLT